MKKKICVVTGSRAEYGIFKPLLRCIQQSQSLSLQLAVTGMHLSADFGLTWQEIVQDGFGIDAQVETLLNSDTPIGTAKSMALGVAGFADVWGRLQPDLILILGDRFEILAAALAAVPACIPIAHIHGGETTEGAIDEVMRHMLTKISHLHFVAAEPYRQRVIQLGEQPHRVFNVGALGLDQLRSADLVTRPRWEEESGFQLGELNFLVTYHPVTLENNDPVSVMEALLTALDSYPQAHILFTKANADAGGRRMNQCLEDYVHRHPHRTALFANLGSRLYVAALSLFDVVLGNSSSGLIEAPFFQTPTVNIGNRQKGRLRATSVFDCQENSQAILQAIQQALVSGIKQGITQVVSPYGAGKSSQYIVQILTETPFAELIHKKFFDIPTRAENL
ncbi:MAG: UDP-N-acetylglucosamine 2-epimerase [Magnetococcus sp. DMHC-6]